MPSVLTAAAYAVSAAGTVLDGNGRPVPDHIADVFQDPQVRQLVGRVRAVQRELAAIGRAAADLNFSAGDLYPHCGLGYAADDLRDLSARAGAVGDDVEAGLPWAVCGGCNGHGCHACRCGYTTKTGG